MAWFTVAPDDFQLTAGAPTEVRSSEHGTRSFCPRCGTPVLFRSSRLPSELDVTTCSLDDPELLPPKDDPWSRSRLSWVERDSSRPEFSEARS